MSKLKIGIVGCGAIGSSLAKIITKRFLKQACVSALYDIDSRKAGELSRLISKKRRLAVVSLQELIKKSDLVIEAASAGVSWDITRQVLKQKRDIMIMSAGGVVAHMEELKALAGRYNSKVYIPSGAISGIDALKAANLGKIKQVTLTTFKNPVSFKEVRYIEEERIDLRRIKKDFVLFSGNAKDAVKYFPQNINVAAILSIAGIGQFKTKVTIIASPRVKRNIHEVRIVSDAGTIYTRTENILHPDNPKTSYLAFLSAVAVLKQILETVKIGA